MSRVLITDYVHPTLLTGLKTQGYHVAYAPEIGRSQVLDWGNVFSGIVINTRMVANKELIDRMSDLRWIARLGSGLDIIDLKYARAMDIEVISTPEANANAVAEHAFGMLLSLIRNIHKADSQVRRGIWEREENRGIEIQGRTVGIIGFGNNGGALAKKFESWGVQILAYDKYKSGFAGQMHHVQETSLENVLANSDILSLHVPLTEETHHMVNDDFLAKCKQGAILINTSRGKVVNTIALLEVLRSGMIWGACLDVFENEKRNMYSPEEQSIYSELHALNNVVLTPHIAGWTIESKRKIAEAIVTKVGQLAVKRTKIK